MVTVPVFQTEDPEGITTARSFVGWNTKADGSGITYHPHRKTNVESDMHLFARWTETDASTYRLNFNIDGLSGVNDGNWYLVDDQVHLPEEDYTGWSSPVSFTDTDVNLSVEGLTEGQTIEVEFDTIMTLQDLDQWGYLQFTDALPSPSLSGHRLMEWQAEAAEEGNSYWESPWNNTNKRRMPAMNLVLQPVWISLP